MCPGLCIAGPPGGGELPPHIFGKVEGDTGDLLHLQVSLRLAAFCLFFQKPMRVVGVVLNDDKAPYDRYKHDR
jgi:hypothetical protein